MENDIFISFFYDFLTFYKKICNSCFIAKYITVQFLGWKKKYSRRVNGGSLYII